MTHFSKKPSRATARAFTIASSVAAAYTLPAMAQSQVNEQVLAPVVVTAARIEQLQSEALPHTTVITAADIRNSQAVDLPTLLRREAGVDIIQSGGPGQLTSLFMRGMGSSQALILLDGVPVRRQGFQNTPALEHILPEQIERIEIVRGNVSAIYGSDAMGGVIQIFTKRGNGAPQANITAEAGSRGTGKISAGTSGQAGNTRYALSLSRFKTDGFSAMNTNQYSFENPDRDGYQNKSFAGSVSQEWAAGQEAGIRLYANSGKSEFDGGGFGSPTDIDTGRSRQQVFTVFSKNRISQDWLSTVTLARTESLDNSNSVAAFGNSRNRFETSTNLLQWSNQIALSSNWVVTAGADAAKEKANIFSNSPFGTSSNSYDRSTSSVHAGINGKVNDHQVQLNARHDDVQDAGSETTGYLGYGYSITPAVKLIASASTAFHAPTLAQFYDPLYGNPNLRAERARSYELGAQFALADTLIRVTTFKTRTRDEFGFDPVTFQTINIGRTENRGVELSASGSFAGWETRTSLTFQDPENESTGATQYRRAKRLMSVAVGKTVGALRVGGEAQYGGERTDRNFSSFPASDVRVSPYTVVNLNARYQMNKQVAVFGRVENLFDREYQTVYGFNQAPRGIFVGLNWQL